MGLGFGTPTSFMPVATAKTAQGMTMKRMLFQTGAKKWSSREVDNPYITVEEPNN